MKLLVYRSKKGRKKAKFVTKFNSYWSLGEWSSKLPKKIVSQYFYIKRK